MYLYTRHIKAQSVPERWSYQYRGNYMNKGDITEKLLNLPSPINPDEVDRIIGNQSWTWTECDECGALNVPVVQVGQVPDYESATACICEKCARKVLEMFRTHRKNLKEK